MCRSAVLSTVTRSKRPPAVISEHEAKGGASKSSHRVFDRDQSEPIPLVVTFIWVRTCNDGVPKCAITAFKASNRGLPKLPTTLPCATLGPAHEDSRHWKIRAWQSAFYQERS